MLRIPCPHCGLRDYTEFQYGGDASKIRPVHTEECLAPWHDHVFLFDNPKGVHREYWQHRLGCRQWLIIDRHTATNVIEPTTRDPTNSDLMNSDLMNTGRQP